MDNASRSERTRQAVMQAALTIISREGPRQLTFDAIAAESGISKGGIMHQFPNKAAVLKGLLEHQIQYFEEFARKYRSDLPANQEADSLITQIAPLQEVVSDPHSVVLAMLAAFVEDPSLLAIIRENSAAKLEEILAGEADRDAALIRWAAARGLAITALVGLCPLDSTERQHIFDCLLDENRWKVTPESSRPDQST